LDAAHAPDDVAAWASVVSPGSAVVTPLAAVRFERLSEQGRVDALVAIQRQLAWLQARQFALLAVMAQASGDASVDGIDRHWVREDVAAALRLSGTAAAERLSLASYLRHEIPETLAVGRVRWSV
jgi:hypothetical protein